MSTYRQLPDASEDELRGGLRGSDTYVSQSDLLAELDRRQTRAINERMVQLTQDVRDMTLAIKRLTWAAVLIAVVAALIALASLAMSLRS